MNNRKQKKSAAALAPLPRAYNDDRGINAVGIRGDPKNFGKSIFGPGKGGFGFAIIRAPAGKRTND